MENKNDDPTRDEFGHKNGCLYGFANGCTCDYGSGPADKFKEMPKPYRFLIVWPNGSIWRRARTIEAAKKKIKTWENGSEGTNPGFIIVDAAARSGK